MPELLLLLWLLLLFLLLLKSLSKLRIFFLAATWQFPQQLVLTWHPQTEAETKAESEADKHTYAREVIKQFEQAISQSFGQ